MNGLHVPVGDGYMRSVLRTVLDDRNDTRIQTTNTPTYTHSRTLTLTQLPNTEETEKAAFSLVKNSLVRGP